MDKFGEFCRFFGGEESFPEESDHFRQGAGNSFEGIMDLFFIQTRILGKVHEIPPLEMALLAVDR